MMHMINNLCFKNKFIIKCQCDFSKFSLQFNVIRKQKQTQTGRIKEYNMWTNSKAFYDSRVYRKEILLSEMN